MNNMGGIVKVDINVISVIILDPKPLDSSSKRALMINYPPLRVPSVQMIDFYFHEYNNN